jgi:universal stress protein A
MSVLSSHRAQALHPFEKEQAMIPKKILFCADFSENSLPALKYAMAYAKAFDAELLIIHVINSSRLGYSSLGEGVPLDMRAALDNIQQSVEKGLGVIAQDCGREVAKVDTFACMGSPAYEIVRFAEERSVDLIVTGTHGWTGFKHLIMGSTAENVVRTASCPVLTVRSSPRADTSAS